MRTKDGARAWLRQHLPEALHERLWVAGGFAVDPTRAEDLDVWLLGRPEERALLETAAQGLPQFCPSAGEAYAEAGFVLVGEAAWEYARLPGPYNWPEILNVQVLLSTAPTIQELLGRFDISTHQQAWSVATGEDVVAPTWTPPGVPPRMLVIRHPVTTWQRLDKIARRYGTRPDPADLERIDATVYVDAGGGQLRFRQGHRGVLVATKAPEAVAWVRP